METMIQPSIRRGTRRCRWPSALIGILWGFALLHAAPAAGEESFSWPEISTTEPAEKQFTVIQHFNYRERLYNPPVDVRTVAEEPESYSGPEAVLAGMLSAMKELDYDWWLATWDPVSRQLILARDEAAGVTREDRLELWRQKVGQTRARLIRWVETGQYVIITYRRQTDEGEGEEQPVAFKLSETGWVATLDLVKDPLFLHVDTDEQRIERRIR